MNEPTDHDSSRDDILEVVAQTLHQSNTSRAEAAAISLDSHLDSDLGFDSLTRAELLVNVERRFGVSCRKRCSITRKRHGISSMPLPRHAANNLPNRASRPRVERAPWNKRTPTARILPSPFETLQQALHWHARKHPQRTYLHWVISDHDVRPLSFGDLHNGSLKVANGLYRHDLAQRDTVALMLPTSHDYFYGFFGALYANAIPVPLYPPARAAQLEEHLRRQAAILNNAQARIMITVPEAKRLAGVIKALVPSLEHVVTPEDLWGNALMHPVASAGGDEIAFLQYTSGSTGNPKGVQLSHANLFANIGACTEILQVDQDDVFVSWLPLYHDMGLIGTCLSSLWLGLHLVVMSPCSS